MARILIVGGGCRGRRLGSQLTAEGHALRITTRTEAQRIAIEASGAECWIGTPDRLATLSGSLENVTIACWLLGGAAGPAEQLAALHASRLRFFLGQVIDTTVRGFIYEARGRAACSPALAEGERIVRAHAQLNAIPLAVLRSDLDDATAWDTEAHAAVESLLSGRQPR